MARSGACQESHLKVNIIIISISVIFIVNTTTLPSRSTLKTSPHYLILDTNIVLEQIDLLESEGLENVIVLTTVLEEVRHRSSPIFKRIKDIIANPKRNFFVFVNEHRRETYVERKAGESANDRNDRAIRVASLWYNQHLAGQPPPLSKLEVVMISDDRRNRELAKEEGLESYTIEEYVSSMQDFPNLVDKINKKEDGTGGFGKKFLFPEHLAPVQLNSGLKSGRLLQVRYLLFLRTFQKIAAGCVLPEPDQLLGGDGQLPGEGASLGAGPGGDEQGGGWRHRGY